MGYIRDQLGFHPVYLFLLGDVLDMNHDMIRRHIDIGTIKIFACFSGFGLCLPFNEDFLLKTSR